MNYSQRGTVNKQKQIKSRKKRLLAKLSVSFFRTFLICVVICMVVGGFASVGFIKGIIDDVPSVDDINVAPTGFVTTVYYSNGSEIQNLVGSEANRVYATLDEIPEDVQNAFIAIEDERFWTHNGIDVKGIIRAFFNGLSKGEFDQGASTLTQQLLKNQVFDGGSEPTFAAKLKRKIQEWYLAVQLEEKLEKKEILEYYLNTINLGQNTLGVRAASIRYFNKDVSELTLSEATVIAGITQSPAYLNPISYPEDNAAKREIILEYMKRDGYISDKEYEDALDDDVYSRIEAVNEEQYANTSSNINSYFVDELINQLIEDFQEKLGYSETQAINLIYRGGLQIHTTQNKTIQDTCDEVFSNESLYPSGSEWELTYRLSIANENGEQKHYSEQHLKKYFIEKGYSSFSLYFKENGGADAYIEEFKASVLSENNTIIGEVVNYTVQPQVSFVLMDQKTGEVLAMIGGRGEKTGNRTLNRATDSPRQPGSTFKIVSTYLPALDTKGMTLATVKNDSEFYYPNTNTKVNNWNKSYKGPTTLREGIYNSMNVIAVKTMVDVTPQIAYDYLMRLGFTTIYDSYNKNGKVYTDIQYPTALGGLTVGVTNFELTASFASIANKGIYTEPILYTKVIDHNGKVLIENEPETRQVMKETTAWLLTDAMKDVITKGTGSKLKFNEINIPIAGKTGTTTNDIDLWFVGYTPYYTAGIWGGYDNNKDQVNTSYHKDLWRTAMQKVHQVMGKSYTDFEKPSGITTATICKKSGKLAVSGICDGTKITEYFDSSTVPKEKCDIHVSYKICKESGKLASEFCPKELIKETTLLKSGSSYKETCPIHTEETMTLPEEPEETPSDEELQPEEIPSEEPENQKPETQKPEIQKPETQKPEIQKPETQKPETQKPETQKPEIQKPETQEPETQEPETQEPETQKPEIQKPENQELENQKTEQEEPNVDVQTVSDTLETQSEDLSSFSTE